MTNRLLSMKHPHRLACAGFATLAALAILSILPLQAQDRDTTDLWKTFEIDLPDDPFYDTFRPNGSPFFSDSLHGYAYWRNVDFRDTTGTGLYETTNGGRTWNRIYKYVPLPHTIRGDYGIAPSGYVTRNGGASWQRLQVAGDQPISELVFQPFGIGETPEFIVGKYVSDDLPTTVRLALSSDGGESWVRMDTVVPTRNWPDTSTIGVALSDTTIFGVMPIGPDTRRFLWEELLGIRNGRLHLTQRPYPSDGGFQYRSDNYITVDLDGLTSSIHAMDSTESSTLSNLTMFYEDLLIGYNSLGGFRSYMVRSTDQGRTWDSTDGAAALALNTLQFPTRTYGITATSFTTDGGVTWKRWGNPWGNDLGFYALDSLHLFGIGSGVSVRSIDGGRTWIRESGNWTLSNTVEVFFAHEGRLLMGAGAKNVLRSDDAGETWHHLLETPGALPSDVSQIAVFFLPDPDRKPDMMRAIGLCNSFDVAGGAFACLLESDDAGATWRNAGRLELFDEFVGTDATWDVSFVENRNSGYTGFLKVSTGDFYRSTDGGETWSFLSAESFDTYAMADDQNGAAARMNEMLRTTDGGESWEVKFRYNAPYRQALGLHAFSSLHYVAISPNELQTPHEWRRIQTHNGGLDWTFRPGQTYNYNDPGTIIWCSPVDVYSFSTSQIRYSSDSGVTFRKMRDIPTQLGQAITHDENYAYLVNIGNRSVGRWELAKGISDVRETTTESGLLHLQILTSGNADGLRVEYSAGRSGKLELALFNTVGARVAEATTSEPIAGRGTMLLDIAELPAGAYFLRATFNGDQQVLPVSILR